MAETNFSYETLKAGPVRGGGAGAAKVIVNDDDLLAAPSKPTGTIREPIL